MPARPPKKRRSTRARSKSKPAKAKSKKRSPAKAKPKSKPKVKKRSSPKPKTKAKKRSSPKPKVPKLKKRKLIAPRKGPPPKPKVIDVREALREQREQGPPPKPKVIDVREALREQREQQREELTFPARSDEWKRVDPYAELAEQGRIEELRSGDGDDAGVLDEDDDDLEIDPNGDPTAPGFEPFKDLPPGVDVHDYIRWLNETYDLDVSQLYEEYFGDGES